MKADIDIDMHEFTALIISGLLKELKPLLGQKTAEPDILFTVETLAEYLHVSHQWVYERVHFKEIPYFKMGKFPRFRKSEIDRWLDTLKTPALCPLSGSLKDRHGATEKTR